MEERGAREGLSAQNFLTPHIIVIEGGGRGGVRTWEGEKFPPSAVSAEERGGAEPAEVRGSNR